MFYYFAVLGEVNHQSTARRGCMVMTTSHSEQVVEFTRIKTYVVGLQYYSGEVSNHFNAYNILILSFLSCNFVCIHFIMLQHQF